MYGLQNNYGFLLSVVVLRIIAKLWRVLVVESLKHFPIVGTVLSAGVFRAGVQYNEPSCNLAEQLCKNFSASSGSLKPPG